MQSFASACEPNAGTRRVRCTDHAASRCPCLSPAAAGVPLQHTHQVSFCIRQQLLNALILRIQAQAALQCSDRSCVFSKPRSRRAQHEIRLVGGFDGHARLGVLGGSAEILHALPAQGETVRVHAAPASKAARAPSLQARGFPGASHSTRALPACSRGRSCTQGRHPQRSTRAAHGPHAAPPAPVVLAKRSALDDRDPPHMFDNRRLGGPRSLGGLLRQRHRRLVSTLCALQRAVARARKKKELGTPAKNAIDTECVASRPLSITGRWPAR